MDEEVTRKEALIRVGAVVAATGMGAALPGALQAQKVPNSTRTIELNLKVPANVEVKTNISRIEGKRLSLFEPKDPGFQKRFNLRPNFKQSFKLDMDLTSAKTESWLNLEGKVMDESSCCCVRG